MSEPQPRERRRLPTLLGPGRRGLLAVGLCLAAIVLANTGYLLLHRLAEATVPDLLGSGPSGLSTFFQAMLLGHTGVGLLAALVMLVFFVAHLPAIWRRRNRASVLSGAAFLAAGLLLVVTGLFILTAAASEANRWAWWLHVAAAILMPAGYLVHRMVGYTRPPGTRIRRFGTAVLGLTLLFGAGHAVFATRDDPTAGDGSAADLAGGGGPGAPGRPRGAPAGFVPPASPFFPSPATTSSGEPLPPAFLLDGSAEDGRAAISRERIAGEVDRRGFVVETAIGAGACARCHPDVVEDWRSSAHRFASFNNPFYEATVRHLRRTATGPHPRVAEHLAEFPGRVEGPAAARSKWCGGCHDPALALTGRMGRAVDRASPLAQAGLTCLACHAVDTIRDVTGNGNYNVSDLTGDPYLFAGADSGSWRAFLHDAALRARPEAHRRRMAKPFFRTSGYCATCHKVSVRESLNGYRWLRGQNEYDAWHDSGVSGNAARTFYLPSEARACQDCHMPPEPAPRGDLAAEGGTVRSHRFLAANTALPYLRGDSATLRATEEFLADGKLRVDLFALRRPRTDPGGPGVLEEARDPRDHVYPLDAERPLLRPGERILLDVVIRNLGVGHTFPGGTNDSNQGWLELSILDGEGRILARSGSIGDDGRLDPMAHVYGAVQLDERGERIRMRNVQDVRVTAALNVIDPGTAEVAHYGFTVPSRLAGGRLVLRARLLWRKFDRIYTEFAHRSNPEGFRSFPEVPDLPITEIATAEIALPVAGDGARDTIGPGVGERSGSGATAGNGSVAPWVRVNDYGIGLLLEGDTRLARRAFREVERLAPGRIDGPLNLARAALRDGDLAEAYGALERVESIRSGDARAAWVWGRVLQEDGRYGRAVRAYRRVLEDFPEDRAAWRNLGRVLYLDGRLDAALGALDRVLEIDPEDRAAHYFRMLTLRAAGREEQARVAEAAFEHYRIDESAQALTREHRARNPGVNLMAQPIHTHELDAAAPRTDGRRDAGTDGTAAAVQGEGAAVPREGASVRGGAGSRAGGAGPGRGGGDSRAGGADRVGGG